jgi:hypothetical protein
MQAATSLLRGPYLQSATPTSMVIRWRTDHSEPSLIRYGTASDQLTLSAAATGVHTEHVVQLSRLTPDTRYYYAIGLPGKVARGARSASRRHSLICHSTRCRSGQTHARLGPG